MDIWFAEQHFVIKTLVVLLCLLTVFFFMGLFAFLGMGTGSSEFPSSPTPRDVLVHIVYTTVLGAFVTLAAAILFGLIEAVVWLLSWLKYWLGL